MSEGTAIRRLHDGGATVKRKVLIISNPDDEHTRKVAGLIRQFGARPVLFYPEALGTRTRLGMTLGPAERPRCSLALDGAIVEPGEVEAVWYRRPRVPILADFGLAPRGLAFARDEWRAALEGMYALLSQPLWVSHPDALRLAARKPLQLVVASELGFTVPRTLITNDPERVREFVDACDGRVVIKATGSGWAYAENGHDVTYVLTNRLAPSDLANLDDVEIAPVTVQEEVPKLYEIRANVVGQRVLAIRIDSQRSELSQVDWRRYDVARTPYTGYQLPPTIELLCLRLTRSLKLEFGAIDLIRRPDGEYVFLEINGNGQFLWAEELSGVQVSHALASLLSGVAPSLASADL
jgi:glutathione synthase/RimK-type ligase-like ATP-grasp enzyme